MTTPGLLGSISPRSPRHVLEELASRGTRAVAAGKERPLVTLELASGRQIEGRCVAVGDDGGMAVALLHVGGSERAPQVAHVRTDHVVAVRYELVKDPPPAQAAPGRLELTRAVSGAAEEVAHKLGAKLELALADPLDEAQRQAVATLLPSLRQALGQLAADPMGKEALGALTAVRLGASTARGVVKASGELHVDAPLPPAEEWTTAELVKAIERAL